MYRVTVSSLIEAVAYDELFLEGLAVTTELKL